MNTFALNGHFPESYDPQRGLSGYFHYRMSDKSFEGTLPLEIARFYIKNMTYFLQGLILKVVFERGLVLLTDLEAFCEGAYFSGRKCRFGLSRPKRGFFFA